MFLQVLGLATVAVGLRETRKLFSRPTLLDLAKNWLTRFPAFYLRTRIVTGTANLVFGSASVCAHGTVTTNRDASVEERVARLERDLSQVTLAIQETQRRIAEDAQRQTSALQSERRERETEDARTQKLLQEAMAGGLHLEMIGVFWLFFGIILATASFEIARWFTGG